MESHLRYYDFVNKKFSFFTLAKSTKTELCSGFFPFSLFIFMEKPLPVPDPRCSIERITSLKYAIFQPVMRHESQNYGFNMPSLLPLETVREGISVELVYWPSLRWSRPEIWGKARNVIKNKAHNVQQRSEAQICVCLGQTWGRGVQTPPHRCRG